MSGEQDISAPEKLEPNHDFSSFDSGTPVLDDWLRRWALPNQESGASRTYVIRAGRRVVGYYALAAGAVARAEATGRTRRNMPDPVPVMVIARLAIDRSCQGRGLGRALLRDAVLRTMQAADIAGIRAVLVHAISEDARRFYERCGFQPSPVDPMTLMITMRDAGQALIGGNDT
ncbi:MAG: GNAT family N-acetyltransferase [Proteobacteria bacterium]|nr:GNAT family N-acetyltransferase [Pseudomonadota bacterium]